MDQSALREAVRNDRIKFATMRPPGSPFATLDRRVVVVDAPDLVELSHNDDPRVLDQLVELLDERDHAWAAQVLLAALTRRDEKLVESFANAPDEWWNTFGATAHQRWRSWLDGARGRLAWDAEAQHFVERPAEASTADPQ
jgi:hypothetical protein